MRIMKILFQIPLDSGILVLFHEGGGDLVDIAVPGLACGSGLHPFDCDFRVLDAELVDHVESGIAGFWYLFLQAFGAVCGLHQRIHQVALA